MSALIRFFANHILLLIRQWYQRRPNRLQRRWSRWPRAHQALAVIALLEPGAALRGVLADTAGLGAAQTIAFGSLRDLVATGQQQPFDLVIIDATVGTLAFQALRSIREENEEHLATLPVLIVMDGSQAIPVDHAADISTQATALISLPFRGADIRHLIEEMLSPDVAALATHA